MSQTERIEDDDAASRFRGLAAHVLANVSGPCLKAVLFSKTGFTVKSDWGELTYKEGDTAEATLKIKWSGPRVENSDLDDLIEALSG